MCEHKCSCECLCMCAPKSSVLTNLILGLVVSTKGGHRHMPNASPQMWIGSQRRRFCHAGPGQYGGVAVCTSALGWAWTVWRMRNLLGDPLREGHEALGLLDELLCLLLRVLECSNGHTSTNLALVLAQEIAAVVGAALALLVGLDHEGVLGELSCSFARLEAHQAHCLAQVLQALHEGLLLRHGLAGLLLHRALALPLRTLALALALALADALRLVV
eukprot:4064162-Alexandrium_andersonii.AAC.1